MPSRRFESHSQSENGLKWHFRAENDKYGLCHGADFCKNDTLSRSLNPENDTLFSGARTRTEKHMSTPPHRQMLHWFEYQYKVVVLFDHSLLSSASHFLFPSFFSLIFMALVPKVARCCRRVGNCSPLVD